MENWMDRGIFLCSSYPKSENIGNEGLLLSDGDAFEFRSHRPPPRGWIKKSPKRKNQITIKANFLFLISFIYSIFLWVSVLTLVPFPESEVRKEPLVGRGSLYFLFLLIVAGFSRADEATVARKDSPRSGVYGSLVARTRELERPTERFERSARISH